MQTLSTAEAATESLPQLFEKARTTPLIVNDGGDDLGVIVSMEDFEIIRRFHNHELLKSMTALGTAMRRSAEAEGVSLSDLEKMLDRHEL